MPYVSRLPDGRIAALHATPAGASAEYLPANNTEVLAFLFSGPLGASNAALLSADLALIRVIEDLVDVLLTKGLLAREDLPLVVRDKLAQRGGIRNDHLQGLGLVGDEPSQFQQLLERI